MELIKVNEQFSYIWDNIENRIIKNISYYDIDEDTTEISYYTNSVSLSTVNFDLTYIKNLSNVKSILDNNLLVVSMFDDKMYYDRNANKSSYHYNSMLFINNEKDIIPLSLNVQDINSPLTIINNEIQTRIDNNTIIDDNNEIMSCYQNLNKSDNDLPGLFKVDNNSLIINNNSVNLSYNVINIIDSIDDHINMMDNVISQCSYNLNHIMFNFKEHQLYDKKYACNLDTSIPLYYSDEIRNNEKMEYIEDSYYHHIDYYQHYFKIKIKLLYNYLSSNIGDYNPFNADNLTVKIDKILDNKDIDICDYIKYNKTKSYIFNSNVTSFDKSTNNIFGEINYVCYFNILNDELYEVLENIINVPNRIPIRIQFTYNDKTINIETSTSAKLDLMIDKYYKKDNIHNILYHDYSVGFNYDKIGNSVGICMIPKSDDYENKTVFMKYFPNESNYTTNRISNDLLKNIKLVNIQSNGTFSDGTSEPYNIEKPTLFENNEDYIINDFPMYKDLGTNINDINSIRFFYNLNSKYINRMYDTKLIYGDYLEYAFNKTYNIHGNGLRKGDCYVPCLSELALFYLYGLHFYIDKYNAPKVYDSSTLYLNNSQLYYYRINYSNDITKAVISKHFIGELKVNEYGQFVGVEDDTTHKSISLFKLPDYSILSGSNYYLEYNESDNCELISYPTRSSISINIRLYNSSRRIMSSDFILVYDENLLTTTQPNIVKKQDNIYQIYFELKKFKQQHNIIDIYFKDEEESMNNEELFINGQTDKYRKLCKLSIKIE